MLFFIVLIIFAKILHVKDRTLLKTGITLILGGALSNEYDRIMKGSVTDYISFKIPYIKEIIELHHGTLTYKSRENRGTTVLITLPKKQEKKS